jgi:PIN domain nuclease of toxin-antitoxin system
MPPLLLDTNAAIWMMRNERLAQAAQDAIDAASRSSTNVWISPITAWEVGLLVSRNRLNLSVTPRGWFQSLLAIPGMRPIELSPEILIASSFLPGRPPRDPMDRILIATARDLGATLVTRDRAILAYGESGQVSTLAC